jgi:hypothetical protein
MSASAIAPSGFIHGETTQFETQIRQQDISNLAYALWQYRGRSEDRLSRIGLKQNSECRSQLSGAIAPK